MKPVVKNIPKIDFVVANEVNSRKFYGTANDGVKGIIVRRTYNGPFSTICFDGFIDCNRFIAPDNAPPMFKLKEFVSYLISIGYEVFEFDSLSECAKWLEIEK